MANPRMVPCRECGRPAELERGRSCRVACSYIGCWSGPYKWSARSAILGWNEAMTRPKATKPKLTKPATNHIPDSLNLGLGMAVVRSLDAKMARRHRG